MVIDMSLKLPEKHLVNLVVKKIAILMKHKNLTFKDAYVASINTEELKSYNFDEMKTDIGKSVKKYLQDELKKAESKKGGKIQIQAVTADTPKASISGKRVLPEGLKADAPVKLIQDANGPRIDRQGATEVEIICPKKSKGKLYEDGTIGCDADE